MKGEEDGEPKALEAAEAAVMREYELGNLTTLGVANHLRRAGFNLRYATERANALAPLPQAHIDPKLVRYIEMLRHECAYKGPCSDNGDGCSCSAEELNERHMRFASLSREDVIEETIEQCAKHLDAKSKRMEDVFATTTTRAEICRASAKLLRADAKEIAMALSSEPHHG